MSGLGITIWLRSSEDFSPCLRSLLLEVLPGYFEAHTFCLKTPSNISAAGGFESWPKSKAALRELDSPFFHQLPAEKVDLKNHWTLAKLPAQEASLLELIEEAKSSRNWSMSVFGNLCVLLGDTDSTIKKTLFRQVFIEAPLEEARTQQNVYAGALLYIHCRSSKSNPERYSLSIRSVSDLWLEQGSAFNKQAQQTSRLNTQVLAEKIHDFVSSNKERVSGVEWDALEGQFWDQEADRIWQTFQIVPSIDIG